MHRYAEALEFFRKVNDRADAGDSVAGKGVLDIEDLDSALLLYAEKQTALRFTDATAAHTRLQMK